MGRRLKAYVPIHRDGVTTWYGPDDEVPPEVAETIRDDAWDDGSIDDGSDAAPKFGPPPMSGKGSGVQAWQDYAAAQHVQLPEGTSTREAIVQALVDAGVPVEQAE